MCGFAGITRNTPAPNLNAVLAAMSQRLTHRGPDDHGQCLTNNKAAGVAHRRLSIVDLSSRGRQPLLNEQRTLALVCNGEIYNHRELRSDLEAKGHRFQSGSDSEVILHLYEDQGPDLVHKIKGMFAFAILNLHDGSVFCARDPVGKKPLFYAQTQTGVAFASEIPALFELPEIDLSIDAEAVGLFLLRNVRHIPDPWTLYKGIRTLSPGHTLDIAHGQVTAIKPYWRPSFIPQTTTAQDVLTAFDRAVERRRIADVEIGALLSGGVDSTAIVDSLNRQGSKSVRTYAFGLDETDEELARARRAADMLSTRHVEILFDADRQHDLFDDLLKQHGQPVMALPLTHASMLFEKIRNDGLKVVLTGHGADEVFYGYDGASNLHTLSNLQDSLPNTLLSPLAKAFQGILGDGRFGDAARVLANPPGRRKSALYAFEARHIWEKLFSSPPSLDAIRRWSEPWFAHGAPKSYIDEAAYLGLMQENAHAVTIAADLPAMAHSIEVRCPFLDRDLLELALTIPYQAKVSFRQDQTNGKRILKKALEGRLPRDLLYAPKRGFGYFVQEDAVLRGPWKQRLDEAFQEPDDYDGLFDPGALRAAKAAFDRGDAHVPAILLAKLYALQRYRRIGGHT